MDTFSHIVMGLGIGALAQIDPVVSNNHSLSQAVLLGAVIGSNAPDFDFIYRMKGKGSYIRNHRGISHSLPALPLWAVFVSGFIYLFLPGADFLHLFLWTFLAVILHVFLDLFNVHGTQVLLPFSRKWISFDSIPLTDPFIFMLHVLGFCLLPFFHSGKTFLVIYACMFLYLFIRTFSTIFIKKYLHSYFQNAIEIKCIPHTSIGKYDVIIETNEDFLFGVYYKNELYIEHSFSKVIPFPELVEDSKSDEVVADLLSSTHFAYPFVRECKKGYLIYWNDLRFRTKRFFRFGAILFISSDLKCKKRYIGHVNSPKQYKKVLKNLKNSHSSI